MSDLAEPPLVFFDASAEVLELADLCHSNAPLFFPKERVVERTQTTLVFNFTTLQFQECDSVDAVECSFFSACLETETDDNKMRYTGFGCGCKSFVCKTCVLQYIKTNASGLKYRSCPFCRSESFCPIIQKTTNREVIGTEIKPITQFQVDRYYKELRLLPNFDIARDFWESNINNKLFADLTPFQVYYWNVFRILSSDVWNDDLEDEELAKRFYICDDKGYLDTSMKDFNGGEELLESSIYIVVREEDYKCYTRKEFNIFTPDEFLDRLLDLFNQTPSQFSHSFIFHHTLRDAVKESFSGDSSNDIYRMIVESENDELILELVKDRNSIREAIRLEYLPNYDWGDITEMLGHTNIFTTTTKHLENGVWISRSVYITEDETRVLAEHN